MQQGFTLVELALVLLIVGLLTRSLIEPLTGARELLDRRATAVQLETIRESLLAHVVAYGFLPCPVEAPLSTSRQTPSISHVPWQSQPSVSSSIAASGTTDVSSTCDDPTGGVPARILGIAGATDSSGQLLDYWNRPYLYAVSLDSHEAKGVAALPDWTSPGEATRVGLSELSASITLCSESHRSRCPRRAIRASALVFVVLSLGKDATSDGAQTENLDNDQEFLLRDESIEPSTRYDDQLVWATAPDIMYWMLRSGWLP